jgi:hypothetical protein
VFRRIWILIGSPDSLPEKTKCQPGQACKYEE